MLKNRPAAFLCLVFSAGIAAGLFFAYVNIIGIIVLGSIAVFVISRTEKKHRLVKMALISMAVLIFGISYAKLFAYFSAPTVPDADIKYTFTAAIRDTDLRENHTYVEAEIQDEGFFLNGERFCINIYGDAPNAGDVVSITGRIREGYYYHRANGIKYVVSGEYTPCEDLTPRGFYFKVLGARKWVGNVINNAYGGESADFYRALFIGDKSGLTAEFDAAFSRSGLSHVMAISGQHFSLIIFNAYLALLMIIRRKKLCSALAIALAIAYTVFTGASPSIVRAAFMCCSIFAASIIDEESDSLINLSLVLVILLAFNPYAIFNTSLQLSFLATMGIIFTLYHMERFYSKHKMPRLVKALILPIAMSLAASLFCTPVFLSRFDYISVLAPLSNFLVNWFVSLAMPLGIVLLIPALIIGRLAIIPHLLYCAIREIAKWVAGMRYACVSVSMPYIQLMVIPSLFMIISFGFFRPKRGIIVFCGAFIITALIVTGCFSVQLQSLKDDAVFYVKEGESNFFAVYADESLTAVIDCNGATGASREVNELGHTYIDAYVVTACTEKTTQRLKNTIPYTPVDTVYIPEEENEYTDEILKLCEENNCKTVRYGNGGLSLGYITVYTPNGKSTEGGYVINAAKNGSSITVFSPSGYIESWEATDCDVFVLTKAGTDSYVNHELLQRYFDRIIVYNDGKNGYYDYVKNNEMARVLEHYEGNLLLRFGISGVIKE